jgi:hypothetical protein
MMERAQVRCPDCRSVVPAMLSWAIGGVCPRCHSALGVGGRRVTEAGSAGRPPAGRASRRSRNRAVEAPVPLDAKAYRPVWSERT